MRSPDKNTFRLKLLLCLIPFLFFFTSCKADRRDFEEQPHQTQSPENLPEETGSWHTSSQKILPGQHLRFDTISLEQGLLQSSVECMLQDSQGFMWLGTESGLNKYDGYTFTIYQHNPDDPNSLTSNWTSVLLEDDSGLIWIGTHDGGLDRYDKKIDQFIHYQHDPDDPFSLSSDEITAIYQDRNGEIWISTGGGLDRFDQENENFVHYLHDPNDPNSLSSNVVSAIFEDQDGVLWIGTVDGGLNRFERENKRWHHYRNDPSDPGSLSHDNISEIFQDQSGTLWIGTDGGGLNKLVLDTSASKVEGADREIEQFIHYQHDPSDPESLSDDAITTIYQDREGILWIGTYIGGLNVFNPQRETFTHFQNIPGDPHSLSSNAIRSIFQDQEGVLWIGTQSGGVSKLDADKWNFAHYKNDPNDPNSLNDNMVWAINQDQDGNLWIGTMIGGLNRFDRESGKWNQYIHDPDNPDSLSNNWVAAIYVDPLDVLWVGTRSGLDRYDSQAETFTHFQANPDAPLQSRSNDITSIYPGQDGNFWIGTADGLYRFDRESESWNQHYYPDSDDPESQSNVILSILEDNDGILWIGTIGGGLNRFDPEKETFTYYINDPDDQHSLSNDIVLSIIQDQEGALWIGTPDGLNKFDQETRVFTVYREKDGMANDNVYCMAEDEGGNIWLSTNKGISRFDPQKEIFRHYDMTNGLQSNEFNITSCYLGNLAEMFFGGINGFNSFFPERIQDNFALPPIVLTSLTQKGEQVDLGLAIEHVTEVTFKWPDNYFEFEFSALSYAHPEKNRYAYMLDGFDKNWNEIGTRRYGKYTNLPGGTYTLLLRGSNNDGNWNEDGAVVKVTIEPPFWSTWWFQGILGIIIFGVAFGIYRLRVRNIESRSQDLELQVEERTAELQREIDQRMQMEEALRDSELEKAVADERGRLARELHDSVTQSLYSLTLFAEAARHLAEESEESILEQHIGQIGSIGLHALKEMRLLVFELRPEELESEGLQSAIRNRLEAVEGRTGIKGRIIADDFEKLPAHIEQEFYRIAQEALNNSLKHASASNVAVHLRQIDQVIEMEILDDGIGFDPNMLDDGGGLGLKGIKERAEGLGGQVSIHSNPGQGTRIKITLENPASENNMDDDKGISDE